MNLMRFQESLSSDCPPDLPPALESLWWDSKGDWQAAHRVVMAHEGDASCDWVHAYLHRREGDAGNARHWYRAAGRTPAEGSLDAERQVIIQALLALA